MSDKSKNNQKTSSGKAAYFPMSARERIGLVTDANSFEEWDETLVDAVLTGKARIDGMQVAIAAMEPNFMAGSMGADTGERLTRMIECATDGKLPIIIFCNSVGLRIQENMSALMQMAKTTAALKKHDEAGLFYLSVLTDPTQGGVLASVAMLGDIILAEPGALIGFAGVKTIEQAAGQKLPEGFQRAEFWQEHGFVDKIVKREKLKKTISFLLRTNGGRIAAEGRTTWKD